MERVAVSGHELEAASRKAISARECAPTLRPDEHTVQPSDDLEPSRLESRLKDIMATVFNQPLDSITDHAEIMAVPGWDSLGHARLMSAIEEEFDIQLTTDAVVSLQSLAEIVEYLRGQRL